MCDATHHKPFDSGRASVNEVNRCRAIFLMIKLFSFGNLYKESLSLSKWPTCPPSLIIVSGGVPYPEHRIGEH